MVGSVSGYQNNPYNNYEKMRRAFATSSRLEQDIKLSLKEDEDQNRAGVIKNPGESTETKAGKKSSPAECETCKERKYQDASDEMVSFKSATHVSPNAAGSAVRAHEQEHVSNAYKKAAQNNGKVMQASVAIHTAICSECGRTYVSGGTTTTQIKYGNESNPYQQQRKAQDAIYTRGANLDLAV